MILILFPLHRPLCVAGRLGERKRKRAGHDGKGKKRNLFPLPIVPLALAIFSIIAIFIGIASGSLCGGESHYPAFSRCYLSKWSMQSSSSSSSSVGCRAGDYELPPATTILCQFRQLARANHVVCVSQKVLNVSEKQGSLPSWFSLPMWWNIQCVLLAWLIIRHPEYMAQKPQLAGSDIFY